MPAIAERESDKYREIWSFPEYHHASPGASSVGFFLDLLDHTPNSVTDFGCGAGAGTKALVEAGVTAVNAVDLVDVADDLPKGVRFTQSSLWDRNLRSIRTRAEYGYCVDVMEHIPPAFTALTVRNMMDCCEKGLFLGISFRPDNLGVLVGKPLHLTVEGFHWWKDLLSELGEVKYAVDRMVDGAFLVEPRR